MLVTHCPCVLLSVGCDNRSCAGAVSVRVVSVDHSCNVSLGEQAVDRRPQRVFPQCLEIYFNGIWAERKHRNLVPERCVLFLVLSEQFQTNSAIYSKRWKVTSELNVSERSSGAEQLQSMQRTCSLLRLSRVARAPPEPVHTGSTLHFHLRPVNTVHM